MNLNNNFGALSFNALEGPGHGIAQLRANLLLRSEWDFELVSDQKLGQIASVRFEARQQSYRLTALSTGRWLNLATVPSSVGTHRVHHMPAFQSCSLFDPTASETNPGQLLNLYVGMTT